MIKPNTNYLDRSPQEEERNTSRWCKTHLLTIGQFSSRLASRTAEFLRLFSFQGKMAPMPDSKEEKFIVETLELQNGTKMSRRDAQAETALNFVFLGLMFLLWRLAPPGHFALGPVIACAIVLILASGIRIDASLGFTCPIQLALVPLFFVTPIALIPLIVGGVSIVTRIPAIVIKERNIGNFLYAVPSSFFTLGPIAVFLISHTAPAHASAGILILALCAQIVGDSVFSYLRCILARNARPSSLLNDGWVYTIDIALSGVGLVVAEEMLHNSIAVFALIPLLGLITMFAQERRHRLQSLLDLNRVQAELSFQAAHDPVTGLANRVTLVGRLEKALATNQRRKERIALLFLDLDGFKQINDKFGHDVGDQLLIAVAKRLESVARDTDTVSRFGGDEFVILCIDLNAQDDAYAIGARFCEALRQPLVVDEQELEVTLSIGVVLADSAHVDAGHLLRQADIAMYQAKHKGRNQVCVLDADVLSEMTPTLGSSPEAKETTPVPALGSRDHCYPQPPAKLHAKSLVLPHSTRTASKSSRSAVPVE